MLSSTDKYCFYQKKELNKGISSLLQVLRSLFSWRFLLSNAFYLTFTFEHTPKEPHKSKQEEAETRTILWLPCRCSWRKWGKIHVTWLTAKKLFTPTRSAFCVTQHRSFNFRIVKMHQADCCLGFQGSLLCSGHRKSDGNSEIGLLCCDRKCQI